MTKGVRIATILFLSAVIFAILFFARGGRDIGSEKKSDGVKTYTHPRLGFSLNYQKDLTLQELEEDGAEIIVFLHPENKNASNSEDKIGFQIFIIPFDSNEALTLARILEDLPGTTIEEPISVIVNPSAPSEEQVSGLVFWSEQAELGRTRELWFVRDGYLYEVTAYAHLDSWLAEQMDSLRFK